MRILTLRDSACDLSIQQPSKQTVVTYFESVGITVTQISDKPGFYVVYTESDDETVDKAWAAFDGTIPTSEAVALSFDISTLIQYRKLYRENQTLATGNVAATLDALCNLALSSLGIPSDD